MGQIAFNYLNLKNNFNLFEFLFRIVSVGGDGLFSEIFTSLLNRTQNDNNVDKNDFNAKLVEPTKPIGIIPAGK